MGCVSSTARSEVPEVQQVVPTKGDFCAKSITTLRLRDHFWDFSNDEDFVICDAEWNEEVFRIRGTTSTMKTLRDPLRTPLVHIKRDLIASEPTYNVFDARPSATKLFCIKALPELKLEFQNPTTGKKCRIGLTGNWAKREASFWMVQGSKGSRTTIGRVFRPAGSRSSAATTRDSFSSNIKPNEEYLLAITVGIDMTLMVLVCIALEQAYSDTW
ncbi:Tubby C-terminal-like domain [Plasmopara halstedii]|uniref:Tubby C-terminal-like domain n=1 Tax=Plasmopara halstedii TaxID=4781 RepID=A0A0P1AWK0_PLAHL|nr:Tubby C-terminal-like domain [Plasmopara halstedii]CEG45849.1 Tubby C-terminal-like domain [Plasmopara halstedii]|eukprot:XP_024582218.1 Tubby C-terminal-like domain [Plasmopara halstedii]